MAPLRSRDFRLVWLAGLISDTGDWALLVSLPIVVYQLTGSASGTSAAFLAELLPGALVPMAAGWLADRFDRRRLLLSISLIQAVALSPLAAGPHLPGIYAVIAVQAGLTAAFEPAKNALLPTLVRQDQLVSANALIGLNQNVGRLLGGALGGAFLAVGGLLAIAVVDAASFLLAALLLSRVRYRRAPSPKAPAGALLVPRGPVLTGLITVGITAIGQGLFLVLFVIFVARSLHGSGAETAVLRGVQALGAILGGLLLTRMPRARPRRLAGTAAILFGLISLLTWNLPPLTRSPAAYTALFVACGVPAIVMATGQTSWLQRSSADGERGRVFAAYGFTFTTGQAAGVVIAGVLGDRLGHLPLLDLQASLYSAAGILALTGRWWTRDPNWSAVDERPPLRQPDGNDHSGQEWGKPRS